MLLRQEVELLALSMDAIHFHLLARFGDHPARSIIGRAKKHATFILKKSGHEGRVWTKRARVLPVTDRTHQINVFNYIAGHGSKGGWVWQFRKGNA